MWESLTTVMIGKKSFGIQNKKSEDFDDVIALYRDLCDLHGMPEIVNESFNDDGTMAVKTLRWDMPDKENSVIFDIWNIR